MCTAFGTNSIDKNDLQPASFNNLNHERTYHWICAALILSSLVPTILLGLNQNILIFSSFPNFLQFSKVFHIFWPHNLPKCLLFQFPVLSPHDNFLRALLSTKPVCISAGLYISKQLKYRKVCDGRWQAFSLNCIFIWKCFPNFPFHWRYCKCDNKAKSNAKFVSTLYSFIFLELTKYSNAEFSHVWHDLKQKLEKIILIDPGNESGGGCTCNLIRGCVHNLQPLDQECFYNLQPLNGKYRLIFNRSRLRCADNLLSNRNRLQRWNSSTSRRT